MIVYESLFERCWRNVNGMEHNENNENNEDILDFKIELY
jgi:hypothetical protein